jgi:hypothetical protein
MPKAGRAACRHGRGPPVRLGADAAAAVQAARTVPGQIATLIAPADTCWNEGGVVAATLPVPDRAEVPAHQIAEMARLLRCSEPVLLLLGGTALEERALADAHRIAAATGAKLMAQPFNGRVPRGQGRHPIPRLDPLLSRSLWMNSVHGLGSARLLLSGERSRQGLEPRPCGSSLRRSVRCSSWFRDHNWLLW